MTRFFVRPEQIANGFVTLDGNDAHHLRVVLKASPGDSIAVLDGGGREWPGVLEELGKVRAVARLGEPVDPATEAATRVTVAQALPRVSDKMEQVLQHGTEVGAAAFWGVATARSQTHLSGDRQAKRLARWRAIVKTAAEQSHRACLPDVRAEDDFTDVLKAASRFDLALLADVGGQTTLREALSQSSSPRPILIVIGPESGLTDAEIQQARRAGLVSVSLGPRILRTETAALTMLSQILFALELSRS